MSEQKLIPIPVKDQRKDVLYSMQMRFKIDIDLKAVNKIAQECGFDEKLAVKNAKHVTLQQTLRFIPDDNLIKKYENIIKEEYLKDNPNIGIHDCKFNGYDYLYPVTLANQ